MPKRDAHEGAGEVRLLAVDLGLKAGLAWYDATGRLRSYRSTNFGTMSRLKKGAYAVLKREPALTHVVIEGGGNVAIPWRKEARRRGLNLVELHAQRWRRELLYKRERASGSEAKAHAQRMAAGIIRWSGGSAPTSLKHDAAEAILIGLWAVQHLGWLKDPPDVHRL
ncbi:MAG: hypothetical protein AAGI08_13990 [Bacteroidota bacterium]